MGRASSHSRAGLLSRIRACDRGTTIAEYAVIAALVILAAGAAKSPRLHPLKDRDCCEQGFRSTPPAQPPIKSVPDGRFRPGPPLAARPD